MNTEATEATEGTDATGKGNVGERRGYQQAPTGTDPE
jgi:hypothetical protein